MTATQEQVRYDVMFEDPASGDTLGLMLQPVGGLTMRLANPYAAKAGHGDKTLHDLSDLDLWVIRDWRGGRAQEIAEDPDRFYDSRRAETRIARQVTLGPLSHSTGPGDVPTYQPAGVTEKQVRYSSFQMHANTYITHEDVEETEWKAQLVELPDGIENITELELYLKNVNGETVNVYVYSNTGTYAPNAQLATKQITGGADGWQTFTLAATLDETGGGFYWIACNMGAGDAGEWYKSLNNNPKGAAGPQHESTDGVTWSALSDSLALQLRVTGEKVARSQGFTTPAAGMNCTGCTLKLRKTATLAQSYTVVLYANSGGQPTGAALKSATITDATLATGWSQVHFSWSTQALAGSTVYHYAVEPPASADDNNAAVEWAGDGTASYASGAASVMIGAAAWAADTSTDMWFLVNTGDVLAGDVLVNPVQFLGKFYCAAGDTVYSWNEGTTSWDVEDTEAGDDVTDMLVWDSKLWVARGSAYNLKYSSDGSAWSDAAGTPNASILWVYLGYIYRTDPADESTYYYTGDGTNWTGPIPAGCNSWGINGGSGFQGHVWLGKDVGQWKATAEITERWHDFYSIEDANNGKDMQVWTRTSELFLPIGHGLFKWNGSNMVSIGPDQDAGLPSGRAGHVVALCGTVNWLYAAVDAGASGTSSVMGYGGRGWHEIVRAETVGEQIRAIGYDTTQEPHRLWYGEGDVLKYVLMPDYTDNPYQYDGVEFAADAEVVHSWWGSDLLQVTKDLRSVVVHSEAAAAGQTIKVYYEADRSARWDLLGTVDDGYPMHLLDFPTSSFTSKTTAADCTATSIALVGTDSTADMTPGGGDWVEIGGHVRQVDSIDDDDTFTLATALPAAPGAGVTVRASQPVVAEMRVKTEMTTDDEDLTPKLLGLGVYFQANVLDRRMWTLNIPISGVTQTLGGEDQGGYDVPGIIAELKRWEERKTPFTFYDPWGETWTVKVSSAALSRTKREMDGEGLVKRWEGTRQLGLVQVEV